MFKCLLPMFGGHSTKYKRIKESGSLLDTIHPKACSPPLGFGNIKLRESVVKKALTALDWNILKEHFEDIGLSRSELTDILEVFDVVRA